MSISISNPNQTDLKSGDKIDMLMNKLSQLEEAFKDERKMRMNLEEENRGLKKITIPNLQKQLEEKESLLKTTFIDKIRLEKQILGVESKKMNDVNVNLGISLLNGKSNSDSLNLSKLEYYQNAYKELKSKYNALMEEKMRLEQEFHSKMDIEKEKIDILKEDAEKLEKKLHRSGEDLKNISQANKNLIIEVRSLNSILDELTKLRETTLMELNFYKSEYEITKSNLKDTSTRLKKMENDFKAVTKNLMETQNKLSNMGISSHIFNVIRIGRLYESNIDLIFTKDEKGLMVLIIKYVTTSIKHLILDIQEIKFKEGEDNTLTIEFKPEKNLRNEIFRTNDGAMIIKTFHEYQKKSYEQLDTKKIEHEKEKKIENIGANLNDIFNFP